MTQAKRYYRPEDIAVLMSVSRRTVYLWIEKGKIKAERIDRAYFIPRSEYCRLCSGSGDCGPCSYAP